MTREEALNKAINIVRYFEAHFAKSKEAREDAVNIIEALEALEQEPCDDCISREAMRKEIVNAPRWFVERDGKKCIGLLYDDVARILYGAPSVTPAEKQEPCKDCISLEAVKNTMFMVQRTAFISDNEFYRTMDLLMRLPSVTPAEKVGQWIMHIDDLFPAESTMECNKCHEHQPITIDDNYCPNCGAKMEEV